MQLSCFSSTSAAALPVARRLAGPCCVPRAGCACFISARQRRARRAELWVAAAGGGSGSDDDSSSLIPDTLPVAGVDSDWRAFRAQLVASAAAAGGEQSTRAAAAASAASAGAEAAWAHSLLRPEHGCLLLANPLMFQTSQTYFKMCVILLFAHSEHGSAGLILNRPTEYTVGELGDGASLLQPELNSCRLFLGGDVGPDSVHLLHDVRGLPGSQEVIPGVQIGGFEEAKAGLAEGRYSADQFKVLNRYAGWGPGQLEEECRRGVWLPVSASKRAVFWQAPPGGSVESMWHHIATLAGSDLAALSREVQGVPDPDIQRAAGGGCQQDEAEECDESTEAAGSASSSSPSSSAGADLGQQLGGSLQARWQQQRRRTRLPETDYRDGAGI